MNAFDLIRTFFEFLAALAVILCFVYEKKLIVFERKIYVAVKKFLSDRKKRKKRFSNRSNTFSLEKENEPTTYYVATYDTWKNSKVKGSRYE